MTHRIMLAAVALTLAGLATSAPAATFQATGTGTTADYSGLGGPNGAAFSYSMQFDVAPDATIEFFRVGITNVTGSFTVDGVASDNVDTVEFGGGSEVSNDISRFGFRFSDAAFVPPGFSQLGLFFGDPTPSVPVGGSLLEFLRGDVSLQASLTYSINGASFGRTANLTDPTFTEITTPVPLPAGIGFLLAGVGSFVLMRRRRARAA